MIKIAVLCAVLAFAASTDYNFTCISGAADGETEPATADCTATTVLADVKCYSPVATVANNTVAYGCGACPSDAAEGTCVACDASSTNDCNAYTAPIFQWSCYKSNKLVACETAGLGDISCFGPTNATGITDTALLAGGCGTCATAGFTNDTLCATCAFDKCNNSAAALVPFLAPLLALLFWLQ